MLCPASEEGQNGVDQELVWMLLSNNNLVGATCVGLASRKQSIDQLRFDVVIIDEAGRSTVPELMIPMLRAKKVVLIGDHFQLPRAWHHFYRLMMPRKKCRFYKNASWKPVFLKRYMVHYPNPPGIF